MLDNAYQLPWLESVLADFHGRMEAGKMPHALLFHGNQGIGKRHLANEIGSMVLCQSPKQGRACGQCKTCYLREAGTHPDCFTIEIGEGSKQILVDQVRDLMTPSNKGMSKLHARATQSGWSGAWKVIVVEPAEAMNASAANSLLKMLEEPPENTLFILISNYLQMVLPTIRSRCQQFLVPLPSSASAQNWLSSQPALQSNMPGDVILNQYLDKPLELIRLVETGLLEKRIYIKNLCQEIQSPNCSITEHATSLASDRNNIVDYMNWFTEEIHQQLKSTILVNNAGNGTEEPDMENKKFNNLNRILDIIQQHIREAHYGSINQRLFWETLLLQWQQYNRTT